MDKLITMTGSPSLTMSGIQTFCGYNSNYSFSIWHKQYQTFDQCFLYTVPCVISHFILLVTAAYLLGKSRRTLSYGTCKRLVVYNLLLFLMLFPSITPVIAKYVLKQKVTYAELLAQILVFLSFLVICILQLRMRQLTHEKLKITKIILVVFLPILVYSSMQLHFIIRHLMQQEHLSWSSISVEYYGLCVYIALNYLFFLAGLSLVCIKPQHQYGLVSIQDPLMSYPPIISNGTSERSSLLGNSDDKTTVDYKSVSKVKPHIDVHDSFNNAGFFSKLTFWWMRGLFQKGSRGQLDTPDDLIKLPHFLESYKLQKYWNELLKKQKRDNAIHNQGLQDQGSPDKARKPKVFSLVRLIHHGVGWYYYSLGLIYLVQNVLEFASPILLNWLIKFMQNEKVCFIYILYIFYIYIVI